MRYGKNKSARIDFDTDARYNRTMKHGFLQAVCIAMAIVTVVAVATTVAICGVHAGHGADCHCPLCLVCVGLSAFAIIPLLLAAARRLMLHTVGQRRDECSTESPVLLAVKMNC